MRLSSLSSLYYWFQSIQVLYLSIPLILVGYSSMYLNSSLFILVRTLFEISKIWKFKGRNFREQKFLQFLRFWPIFEKVMPGKKLNEKFTRVIFQTCESFFKFGKPKTRKEHIEQCRNSLVLKGCRLSRQTIKQIFQKCFDSFFHIFTRYI